MLANDAVTNVSLFVDIGDVCRMSRVCKQWSTALQDDYFWQQLYNKRNNWSRADYSSLRDTLYSNMFRDVPNKALYASHHSRSNALGSKIQVVDNHL